jgi:CRP-like cAMP-binding protein
VLVLKLREQRMPDVATIPVPNLFLAALHSQDLDPLRPHLEAITMTAREFLHEKDRPVDYIYFPAAGMISLIIPLEDGGLVEAGIVGKENAVGLAGLAGASKATVSAMVQMPGSAFRIRPSIMREQMIRSHALAMQVLRFSHALNAQLSYSAVCNVRHTLPERLARWLLMAHDRGQGDVLPLTQEFMGILLGVRRSGITLAARRLQQRGAITYTRGRVTIRDRALLEQSSCECYAAAAAISRALIGWPAEGRTADRGQNIQQP